MFNTLGKYQIGLISFVCGLLGVIAALIGYHLYTDHKLVDAVRMDIMQRQMNQNANQKPAN